MTLIHIARHEFRRFFVSPLAWAVLAVVQIILAVVFIEAVVEYMRTAARLGGQGVSVSNVMSQGLFGLAAVVLLLVVPLLTMRLFSEERSTGTMDLLFSAPASLTDLVLGKFLGLLGFLVIMLAIIAAMPLSLLMGTHLDIGRIFAGLLGLLLIMAAFGAAGLFVSTLTAQPTVAAVGSFGLLLLLWLARWAGHQHFAGAEAFAWLSIIDHYNHLLKGEFNTGDIAYYLLFIGTFLGLSEQRLDMERT
jgi:ABC-2 type transport system permease protein